MICNLSSACFMYDDVVVLKAGTASDAADGSNTKTETAALINPTEVCVDDIVA